jgi:hypothetical protein
LPIPRAPSMSESLVTERGMEFWGIGIYGIAGVCGNDLLALVLRALPPGNVLSPSFEVAS